jgi:N-acetylglucosamine malate deacetylase 1
MSPRSSLPGPFLETVLVVAPHPDDEIVGCGGLLQRVKAAGGRVYVLFMTVGDTRDFSSTGRSCRRQREREIEAVAAALEFDGHGMAFPGNRYHLRLDRVPQGRIIAMLECASELSIGRLRPSVVLFPSPFSYNQDHRAVASACLTALRPGSPSLRHQPALVLMYEQVVDQWSMAPSEFVPNLFIELSPAEMDGKIDALRLYESQWREEPNGRSESALRALAVLRGAQAGMRYAEAFDVLRWACR